LAWISRAKPCAARLAQCNYSEACQRNALRFDVSTAQITRHNRNCAADLINPFAYICFMQCESKIRMHSRSNASAYAGVAQPGTAPALRAGALRGLQVQKQIPFLSKEKVFVCPKRKGINEDWDLWNILPPALFLYSGL